MEGKKGRKEGLTAGGRGGGSLTDDRTAYWGLGTSDDGEESGLTAGRKWREQRKLIGGQRRRLSRRAAGREG